MPDDPSPKLCECGCGQAAPIAKQTDVGRGYVKGQPRRFARGHNNRGRSASAETRRKMREAHAGRVGTPPSEETRRKLREANLGKKKSDEHRRRLSLSRGGTGETSSSMIHAVLRRDHPKAGVCEECGNEGKTHYAFLHHPEPHTRDRSDYRELCPGCHKRFDSANRP